MEEKRREINYDVRKLVDQACKNEQPQTIENDDVAELVNDFLQRKETCYNHMNLDDIIKVYSAALNNMIETIADESNTKPFPIKSIKSDSTLYAIKDSYQLVNEDWTEIEFFDTLVRNTSKRNGKGETGLFQAFGIELSGHNKRMRNKRDPGKFVKLKYVLCLKCDSQTAELILRLTQFGFRPYKEIDQLIMMAMDKYHQLSFDDYELKVKELLKAYGYSLSDRLD